MGACSHTFTARDDDWIRAAGFDPSVFPEYVSVEEYLVRIGCMASELLLLREAGFAQLQRHYILDERFKRYGVEIVSCKGGERDMYGDSEPRTIKLSNGLTLMEVRDYDRAQQFYDSGEFKAAGYEEGYDFVFFYRVEAVNG